MKWWNSYKEKNNFFYEKPYGKQQQHLYTCKCVICFGQEKYTKIYCNLRLELSNISNINLFRLS